MTGRRSKTNCGVSQTGQSNHDHSSRHRNPNDVKLVNHLEPLRFPLATVTTVTTMSSGRGGAGNLRLNTGSGLKGKGRANEDTIASFFGREISTVFQNVRTLAQFPTWPLGSGSIV